MEKFFFKKIEVWLVLLLGVFAIVGMIAFGVIVRNVALGHDRYGKIGEFFYAIASAPSEARKFLSAKNRNMAISDQSRFPGKAGWSFVRTPAAAPPDGYLLFSRYDGDKKHHVIELLDLSTGTVEHRIGLDADSLLKGAERDSEITNFNGWTKKWFRAIHPLALENGDVILKDHATPLIRINACGALVWRQQNDLYHHSTEVADDGTIWVPSHVEPPRAEGLKPGFHDPGIVRLNTEGEVLFDRSLTDVMLRHRLAYLLFTGGTYNDDPIHLNDIQPALSDGPFWRKGDLFLSLRNLSMVMLYRPSTDEIIWMKQGPWASQHDVDIINDHTIAVFNNNKLDKGDGEYVEGVNEVMFYDFATDTVTSPYRDLFEQYDIRTETEGLFTLLPSGHLLVEESDKARFLIFAPDGTLVAENVNRGKDGLLHHMGWSRFIEREQGDIIRDAMRAQNCGGSDS